ncbi:hypothetical protein SISSUDRAFT_389641 [Sistotremastrum suecicum HHB10207 ss-3]|uniref:Xylanolytic transcriptional activator regulatory domain-containing protein n=1 Tax=Sistotremastrum suecicum HHB10207 ss-3 TaxID=1314776 RepID=A0A165YXS1_9AGAM|nr:hypothetical protein SISSUDRAFT_389641 [Sistotremastrum suecicum HHB10207 ss-3]
MIRRLVTESEVKELFEIYFNDMNPSISLLDPLLYTPEKTFDRSPFLFGVICSIASRFMPNRYDLFRMLSYHAQQCASGDLIFGKKTVESVQAYILMALYPMPSRQRSENRSWMYLGCAIRLASKLNLHYLPSTVVIGETATPHMSTDRAQQEAHTRELLNRTRTCFICHNLDQSFGMLLGKPLSVRDDWVGPLLEKYIEALGDGWWCETTFGLKFDLHICALNALLRAIAKFHQTVFSDSGGGVNTKLPLETLAQSFEDEIEELGQKWSDRIGRLTPAEDTQLVFRLDLLRFEYSYNRLMALVFAFQSGFRGVVMTTETVWLDRCHRAAIETLNNIIDLAPNPYLRFAPASFSISATFACTVLLKLVRPRFSNGLEAHQEEEILKLVARVIDMLNTIAVDEHHTPRRCAIFLRSLFAQAESRRVDHLHLLQRHPTYLRLRTRMSTVCNNPLADRLVTTLSRNSQIRTRMIRFRKCSLMVIGSGIMISSGQGSVPR